MVRIYEVKVIPWFLGVDGISLVHQFAAYWTLRNFSTRDSEVRNVNARTLFVVSLSVAIFRQRHSLFFIEPTKVSLSVQPA
jgi:hypothetical protein